MKKITLYRSFVIAGCMLLGTLVSHAQFTFANSNSRLSSTTHSGCAMAVVDINNDGLDDIVTMDQSTTLIIMMQHPDGTYTTSNLGNISGTCGATCTVWGMAVNDIDHNGWKDVVTGTRTALYLVKISGSGYTCTGVASTMATGGTGYFVQNVTFGDFNNDGWDDVEVCDDVDYSRVYQNDGTGNLNVTTTLINTNINPGLTYAGDPYDSGNYGSVWTDIDGDGDLDLYIAHCRQSTSSYTDERRRDRLFINDGTNHYTENAASTGMELPGNYKQTWTTSFGDMDNDGDFDCVMTNHGEASQIYANDGAGHFTDVTTGSGFTVPFDAIESAVEDFDNDGYLDILVTGPGWVMYHNNGNGTYTAVPSAFAAGGNILSIGMGDLNHDGKVDIYASYGTVYNNPSTTADVLYLNTTSNTNHFITFNLTGTVSNHDAVGAKVNIYGPWGKQVREVRAGETYGNAYSMQLHFGLGTHTMVDSAVIQWPSHMYTNHFVGLAADQFVTVVEGGCSLTGNVIPGPFVTCTAGSTINLTTGSFSTYNWTTGSTASSISAGPGTYNVTVTNAAGCTNISPSVTVSLGPDQTPSVSTAGPSGACAGSVTLTSSTASSYAWTGPSGFTASTQSITPPVSGTYQVTIVGTCANFTSAPTTVSVVSAPAPTTTGASSPTAASVTLNATGTGGTLNWYTAPTGGAPIATGTSYTTPVLSTTTTYYVDETNTYPGASGHTSQMYHTGTSTLSTTTNGAEVFDVLSNCTLQSVKVYVDAAHHGIRRIELLNSSAVILDSMSINLATDTVVIPLNWAIPVGTGYQLTTDAAVNTANFASVNPYLWRSSTGVTYPYTLSGVLSVTGSTPTTGRVYYFYDWVVQGGSQTCTSSRATVVATIGSVGIGALSNTNGVEVYPNPAVGEVNVKFDNAQSQVTTIELTDVTGRLVKTWSVDKPVSGQEVQLNVTEFNAGTYFLNIKTDSRKLVQKLMLTK
jgi:hypothetical protein